MARFSAFYHFTWLILIGAFLTYVGIGSYTVAESEADSGSKHDIETEMWLNGSPVSNLTSAASVMIHSFYEFHLIATSVAVGFATLLAIAIFADNLKNYRKDEYVYIDCFCCLGVDVVSVTQILVLILSIVIGLGIGLRNYDHWTGYRPESMTNGWRAKSGPLTLYERTLQIDCADFVGYRVLPGQITTDSCNSLYDLPLDQTHQLCCLTRGDSTEEWADREEVNRDRFALYFGVLGGYALLSLLLVLPRPTIFRRLVEERQLCQVTAYEVQPKTVDEHTADELRAQIDTLERNNKHYTESIEANRVAIAKTRRQLAALESV